MKDFLGQTLAVGDAVVINDKRYSNLVLAKIVKFTPTMVRVEVYAQRFQWNQGWSGETVLCSSSTQVLKVEQELVTMWLLKDAK